MALYSHSNEQTLYITKKKELSSLLKPNYTQIIKLEYPSEIINWNIVSEEKIKTQSLESFLKKNNIKKIDYIKLDTQGTEFEIIKGLNNYINKVGIIKIEVEFLELYKSQKLFPEIHKFLEKNNFKLQYFTRIVCFSREYKSAYYIKNNEFKDNIVASKYKLKVNNKNYKRLKYYYNRRIHLINYLIDYTEKNDIIDKIKELLELDNKINSLQNKLLKINQGEKTILIERNLYTIFGDAIYINKNYNFDSDLQKKLCDVMHIKKNEF